VQPGMSLIVIVVVSVSCGHAEADIEYADFGSVGGLSLVQAAEQHENVLRLTGYDPDYQSGAAWYAAKQNVASGFRTTFRFRITPPPGQDGGDGFAFLVQNSSDTAITQETGCGSCLGYAGANDSEGIPNSLAVEFDMLPWDGSDDQLPWNHISVQTRGTSPNRYYVDSSLGIVGPIPELNNGSVHTATMVYSPGLLRVFMNGRLMLTVGVDLEATLDLDEGRAWVGFTAGTGAASEDHDILGWSFQECAGTVDSDGDGVGDMCDLCPGFSDAQDGDGDAVSDQCDNCPIRLIPSIPKAERNSASWSTSKPRPPFSFTIIQRVKGRLTSHSKPRR
jgi:hypothetical protein